MSVNWDADALVKVRTDNLDRYKRNYLRQAVCELRFPTVMEFGESKPPASFVKALRKEYPILELANQVTLGVGGGGQGALTHILRSSKRTWSVSLKQSALSIETTVYSDYAHMKQRVLRVVEAASHIIDSDFFTRIGLRYINVLGSDTESSPEEGWVNPSLVEPILSGDFSGINEYAGKMQLLAADGGCLLQHGIRFNQNSSHGNPEYVLDIDAFRSDVALDDTESALDIIHLQAFSMFDWGIGEKARAYLSEEA